MHVVKMDFTEVLELGKAFILAVVIVAITIIFGSQNYYRLNFQYNCPIHLHLTSNSGFLFQLGFALLLKNKKLQLRTPDSATVGCAVIEGNMTSIWVWTTMMTS